jgi:kumamolisin
LHITLRKSNRQQPAGAVLLKGGADQRERIEVTVVVRPRVSAKQREREIQNLSRRLPHQRQHLNAGEFLKQHGARQKDLTIVEKFGRKHKLEVVESSAEKRSIILAGSLSAISRAFQVRFQNFQHHGVTYRSFAERIRLPADLKGIVEGVLGLDNRALMSHHTFTTRDRAVTHTQPREVMRAYEFPKRANGKGQGIAIIELGGGFYESDIKEFFNRHHLKMPNLSVVEIDGQKNNPASPEVIKKVLDLLGLEPQSKRVTPQIDPADASLGMWTIESTLDVELIGAFANAANIVVYFAPNTAQGKYRAISTALNSKENPVTVISCSWGAVEEDLPEDFINCTEQLFRDAALKGVTICFSSGDKGDDCGKDGRPRAHYPASSPLVLGCGGTHWEKDRNRIREVVWNETLPHGACESGGGSSKFFKVPGWQKAARVKTKSGKDGRGVPDVAGKADIKTGYCMLVGGYDVSMGGTSASAPMWAGLIARMNQKLKKSIGYLTPLLYRPAFKRTFTDITEGNSGKNFCACRGWDPCTGLGSPRGKKLLSALKGKQRQSR